MLAMGLLYILREWNFNSAVQNGGGLVRTQKPTAGAPSAWIAASSGSKLLPREDELTGRLSICDGARQFKLQAGEQLRKFAIALHGDVAEVRDFLRAAALLEPFGHVGAVVEVDAQPVVGLFYGLHLIDVPVVVGAEQGGKLIEVVCVFHAGDHTTALSAP